MRRAVIALGGAALAAVVVVFAVTRGEPPEAVPRADDPAAAPRPPTAPPPTAPTRETATNAPATTLEAQPPPSSPSPPPPGPLARPRLNNPGAAAGAIHTTGGRPLAQPIRDRMLARLGDPALAEARAATDPRTALAAYDRYLAQNPRGAAREQAMAGRATSLEAVGKRAQAAAAWRAVAEAYPASMTAPNARRRAIALER